MSRALSLFIFVSFLSVAISPRAVANAFVKPSKKSNVKPSPKSTARVKRRSRKSKRTLRRKRARRRRLASLSTDSASSIDYFEEKRRLSENFRLSLLSGVSNSSYDAFGIQQGASTLHLGGGLDFQTSFFGLEADGFFESLPTAQTSGFSSIPSGEGGSTASAYKFGFGGTLKGQIPFSIGGVRIIPKAGAGYSRYQLANSVEETGSTFESNFGVAGIHALLGIEVQPLSGLMIMADYVLGFANSTTEENQGGDPQFNRLRLSAFYQLFRGFSLGFQYSQLSFSISTINSDVSERFLGAIMVHF